MKQQNLSLDLLRIDGGTQSRLAISEEVVESYAELIGESKDWPFPPLDVFHDGTDYYVADGFHRKLAAVKAKRASVPCNVHEGTATDARIFGMTANDRHGLRMTRADKRACVEWLLDNPPKRTQAEIAQLAGVTTRMVKVVVAERNAESLQGRLKPSKQDSKGNNSPSTPKSSSSETEPRAASEPISNPSDALADDPLDFPEGPPADLGTPDEWNDEKPAAPKKGGKPAVPVKALEGREADAFDARRAIHGMYATIKQWYAGKWSLDEINNEFPHKLGEQTIKAMGTVYELLQKWEKVVK